MFGGVKYCVVVSLERFARWAWTCTRSTTRGLLRCRRGGLSLSRISAKVAVRAFASLQGGKRRLVGDLAADDTQRSHERQSVRILVGLVCRFAHETPDRIVSEQESPYLLLDHFG